MKVLRNGMVILVLLFLFTSCGIKQEETTLGKGESVEQTQNEQPRVISEKQSLDVQIQDQEIREFITEVLEENGLKCENQTIEQYTVISVHAGSVPKTNLDGGYERDYRRFIDFCYEVNGRIYFQTVSTYNPDNYEYIVACRIGEENKLTVVSGKIKYSTIQKIYCFTLTKETYQTIYNS